MQNTLKQTIQQIQDRLKNFAYQTKVECITKWLKSAVYIHRSEKIGSNNAFAFTKEGNFIRIIDFIIDPLDRIEYTICDILNTDKGHSPEVVAMRYWQKQSDFFRTFI